MQIEHDTGLVLKKTLYQDKKLMVNIFCEKEGLISFSVTLGKHSFARLGCFEAGHVVRLELIKTRTSYRLHDAEVLFSPLSLRQNFELVCLWVRFLDTLHRILPPNAPSPMFFELLKNGLKALDLHPHKKDLTYFIFLKWLQSEGILGLDENHTLYPELSCVLSYRRFDQLKPLSFAMHQFIDNTLLASR